MKSTYLDSDINKIVSRLAEFKERIEGKNFLLTGSEGLLGTYLQAVLSRLGAENIICIDREKSSKYHKNVDFYQLDINEPETLSIAPRIKMDYVLCLASIASPRIYKQYPIDTLMTGSIGLINSLNRAVKDKARALCFSSSEVYGTASIIPTPETYVGKIDSNNSRSPYDMSKKYAEVLAYAYYKEKNLDVSSLRLFNVYGPSKKDGRVLPSFFDKLIKRHPLEIFDGGGHTRTYQYITDGICGVLQALFLGKRGEIYNIGNPNDEISVVDLVKKIEKITSTKIDYEIIDYPKDYAGESNPLRRSPCIDKAKKELGYNPEVSLEEGLARFYGWAKENY